MGFVELWDVPNRKRTPPLLAKVGHLVVFAPGGDLLATAADRQVLLWRTDTRDLIGPLKLADRVQALELSPDGRQLATLSFPDEVTVWDIEQRSVTRRIPGVRPAYAHLGALGFSPDGKSLVVGDADRRLRVIDLASGNTDVNIPDAHRDSIAAVAWSPDGSLIASGGGYDGGPIRLWDTSGNPRGELEGHTAWICELVFSADSARLYSASADQTIRIWDIQERRHLTTLRGSTDEVHGLALSPDGSTLASADKDGVVAFWNARPRPQEEQPRRIALGAFASPAFAPSGRVLAVPRKGTVTNGTAVRKPCDSMGLCFSQFRS
jgi:WD40 repeat protein